MVVHGQAFHRAYFDAAVADDAAHAVDLPGPLLRLDADRMSRAFPLACSAEYAPVYVVDDVAAAPLEFLGRLDGVHKRRWLAHRAPYYCF